MAQNVYDNPEFLAGYQNLPRSREGLAGAPEWPSLRAMLPPLAGARVLDLGCGFGWFARFAREQGASHVLGLDVSERMLARAAEMTRDDAIEYRRADLDAAGFPESAFDLVFSSLALHYIVDLGALIGRIARALKPGGAMVVSMEHPVFQAPPRKEWAEHEGRRIWPLQDYFREGPRLTDWFVPDVQMHHRTMGTILRYILGAGLALTHLEEWCPDAAQIALHPEWEKELDRPIFLLLAARKP
ncbi:class I SAM-dependent methyltransferase [Roseococcus sp. YIM B11640]|uniref:class I SAM-dependent methyltransferase n=1 Tax=Roseococcus sp. YIM B11640 TaxID=3133973 RepID=UPI003C7CA62B